MLANGAGMLAFANFIGPDGGIGNVLTGKSGVHFLASGRREPLLGDLREGAVAEIAPREGVLRNEDWKKQTARCNENRFHAYWLIRKVTPQSFKIIGE